MITCTRTAAHGRDQEVQKRTACSPMPGEDAITAKIRVSRIDEHKPGAAQRRIN